MTSASLDARARGKVMDALEGETFDLIVIGGGITGAGVARDAALRGLKVALLEARDWASGTSSRSSKMIHGGLRYLAQGDVALVKEAASERLVLRRIAPHLARMSWFVITLPNLGALAKMRAGLWTFEKLGNVPASETHQVWDARELKRREPLVKTAGLHGAVAYPEFLTDDARLTLANVRSAQAAGARVLNYLPVTDVLTEGGQAVGVLARAAAPGEAREVRVRGRLIVNAAGPWVDAVRALEDAAAPPRLSLTKGVHVVVRRERLPVTNTVILRAPDKRGTFAVPHGDYAYIGTTDTFHEAPDAWPPVTKGDVDYLFASAEALLETGLLRASDIVSVWSGVRPLVAQPGKGASEISRKDEVWTGPAGVVSIAGGKLSAYRAMAERIVDQAVERLGVAGRACVTADDPLPTDEAAQGVAGEAERAVLHEGAVRLEDWWARRSSRALFDEGGGMTALAPAADAMGALLGWDAARRAAEISHCEGLRAASLADLKETASA